MFAIDDPAAVAAMPIPEAAGTPGFFTEGNPALGQAATYVRASWLNALQLELLAICTAAGITPSKTAYNQILTAMRSNGLIYAIDTGVANACVTTFTPAVAALTDGMVLWFKAKFANSGATTLNVNGLGAAPVVGAGQNALQGGEIAANGRCQVIWNATSNSWVLIECTGAALQVGAATQSQHAMQLGQAIGRLVNVQTISATGIYTATAGTNFVIAEGVGGGASGCGAPATTASAGASAGGGGSGSYFKVLIRTGFSGVTVTVGAGGAGVSGAAGTAGGATSFGSFATAPGGATIAPPTPQPPPNASGGATPSAIATASPGAGGVAITLSRGMPGGYGVFAANGNGISGVGAPSVFGPGGAASVSGGGIAGSAPGSGGSGGYNNFGSSANAGGAGAAGQVIVWEFS